MPSTVTVLYPNVEGLWIDIQKYLDGHMPKVLELMGPHGLRAMRAVRLHSPPWSKDTGSGYTLQVALDWDSVKQFQHAYELTSSVLMGDIESFSNMKPLIMTGDIIVDQVVAK